ncbi:MAG: homoserine kinase [Anaerolineaceae bacterium]|nr:homoserine kinase [Anaerolineaceae bacterium]
MSKNSFTVYVPATTANLGPGFDCLGLALDLWNTVTFSLIDAPALISITGEGKNLLPKDRTNLIYQSAHQLANTYSKTLPENLHISCQNNIPVASGLGSSAAAVISGLIGAKRILNINISDQELLQTAAQIEGHADNAAACLFGGLSLVWSVNEALHISHREIHPITAVIAIPEYLLSTKSAREVLPEKVRLEDAVYNISRTVELVHILQKGNYESLGEAMNDKLHQIYRLPLLPGADLAMQAALDAGAYGTSLSGAGPSVVAFTAQEFALGVGNAMQLAYQQTSISSRILRLRCPVKGCLVN